MHWVSEEHGERWRLESRETERGSNRSELRPEGMGFRSWLAKRGGISLPLGRRRQELFLEFKASQFDIVRPSLKKINK